MVKDDNVCGFRDGGGDQYSGSDQPQETNIREIAETWS